MTDASNSAVKPQKSTTTLTLNKNKNKGIKSEDSVTTVAQSAKPPAKPRGRKKSEVVTTPRMVEMIAKTKKMVAGGSSKADAARYAYEELSDHSRQQILIVFQEGCSLTKAGSSTYYGLCQKM